MTNKISSTLSTSSVTSNIDNIYSDYFWSHNRCSTLMKTTKDVNKLLVDPTQARVNPIDETHQLVVSLANLPSSQYGLMCDHGRISESMQNLVKQHREIIEISEQLEIELIPKSLKKNG